MFFGQGDDLVPVGPPGKGEHDVGRAILAGEIRAHRLDLHRGDRLHGAQDALPERVRPEVERLGRVVGDGHRIILIHLDLFDDHLLLGVEVVLAKRGAQDVGQDVERSRQILGQAGDVIERVFFGGLRVVLGADAVEVAVDRQRVAPRRSLEDHMLKEVRHARDFRPLVAAPCLDEEPRRHRAGLVVQFGDDLKAVIENRLMKWHDRFPICGGACVLLRKAWPMWR